MIREALNNRTTKTALVSQKSKKSDTVQQLLFSKNHTTQYLELLAEELRTSRKVVINSQLKSEKWSKSCYELLSNVIRKDLNENLSPEIRMVLGTSLSAKTLQKIISKNYRVSYPIDPRTINTLNKLALFLGYKNWDQFVLKKDSESKVTTEETDIEEELLSVVREAISREHFTYCELPEIHEEHLLETYIKGSPAYNRIMDALTQKSNKKQIISNNYNPSTYEILEMEVNKIEDNYAQIHTKEYWLLCWWCPNTKRYVQRFKNISDHYYILKKQNNRWLIRTNASQSDFMELV